MAFYNSYPPHRLHSSHPIAPSEALSLLSSYLEASATDASLHPNALLTENGPVSTTSGSNTGLVLHNLKRVEAGLQGKHLAADLSFTRFVGEGLPELQVKSNEDVFELVSGSTNDGNEHGAITQTGMEGWQDKVDFEREQGITQGEVGDRMQAVVQGPERTKVPSVEGAGNVEIEQESKKRKKRSRRNKIDEQGVTTQEGVEARSDELNLDRERELDEGEIRNRSQAVVSGPEGTLGPRAKGVSAVDFDEENRKRKKRKHERRHKEKREREDQKKRNKMAEDEV